MFFISTTLLHIATATDNLQILQFLIEKGMNINSKDIFISQVLMVLVPFIMQLGIDLIRQFASS